MDLPRFFLIACAVTLLGVALPAALFIMLQRQNPSSLTRIVRQVGTAARQPWKKTDDELDELSRRVSALRGADRDSSQDPPGAPDT